MFTLAEIARLTRERFNWERDNLPVAETQEDTWEYRDGAHAACWVGEDENDS